MHLHLVHAAVLAAEPAQRGALTTGGAIGTGTLVIVCIAWYLHHSLKRNTTKTGPIIAAVIAGVLMGGTVVGSLATTMADTAGTGIASVLGSVSK